jgi:hypothetical protein
MRGIAARLSEVTLAGLLATSCVQTRNGNGVPAEERRDLDGFDRVFVAGVLEVEVTAGQSFEVRIRIDENLLEHVGTRVVAGDGLRIGVDGNLGDVLPGPHVSVTLPSLLGAGLRGSGALRATGFDEAEPVILELNGSGELSFEGRAPALGATLGGSGNVILEGRTERLELSLSGSGDIAARALPAQSAALSLDGSGSIAATVDGRVDAALDGSGRIDLYGTVTEGAFSEEGGGAIVVHAER